MIKLTRMDVIDFKVNEFLANVLKETGSIDFVIDISPRRNFIFNTLSTGCNHDLIDKYENLSKVANLLGIDEFNDIDSWEKWIDSLMHDFEREFNPMIEEINGEFSYYVFFDDKDIASFSNAPAYNKPLDKRTST